VSGTVDAIAPAPEPAAPDCSPARPVQGAPAASTASAAPAAGAAGVAGSAGAAGGHTWCREGVPSYLIGPVRRWYVQAAQHHNCGRPDLAAELLVSAVTLEPSFGCLREALARAQFDAGQYLAARTTFTAMVALDARDHYALFGLGLVQTRLGVPAAAARQFERAAELCPDEPRYAVALEHARVQLAAGAARDAPATAGAETAGSARAG
jgi:tetratricopeptide (TPR) repeat protein